MPAEDRDLLRDGYRVTVVGILVNALLAGLKLAAGIVGNSQALVADAAHSLSDFFTDAVVLFGLKAGRKAPDASHPWGHGRIETLAAAIVALSLLGAAAWIGVDAVRTLLAGEPGQPGWIALPAAIVSIVAKEALYRATVVVGRRARSAALMANAWHHRTDALSSIAVAVGLFGAALRPEWRVLDSYAALVVTALIVHAALKSLVDSLKEIVDTAPDDATVAAIHELVATVDGVLDVHDLKVRTTGGFFQIEVHIVVDGDLRVVEGHAVAEAVEVAVRAGLDGVAGVIVHVDPPSGDTLTTPER